MQQKLRALSRRHTQLQGAIGTGLHGITCYRLFPSKAVTTLTDVYDQPQLSIDRRGECRVWLGVVHSAGSGLEIIQVHVRREAGRDSKSILLIFGPVKAERSGDSQTEPVRSWRRVGRRPSMRVWAGQQMAIQSASQCSGLHDDRNVGTKTVAINVKPVGSEAHGCKAVQSQVQRAGCVKTSLRV